MRKLITILAVSLAAVAPLSAHAARPHDVCRVFARDWVPADSPALTALIERHARSVAAGRTIVACSGGGALAIAPIAASVTISDSGTGPEDIIAIGVHTHALDAAPPDVLEAIVLHEIGHLVLRTPCGRFLEESRLAQFTDCEYAADRYAAERVGACAIASAIKWTQDAMTRSGSPPKPWSSTHERHKRLAAIGGCPE